MNKKIIHALFTWDSSGLTEKEKICLGEILLTAMQPESGLPVVCSQVKKIEPRVDFSDGEFGGGIPALNFH